MIAASLTGGEGGSKRKARATCDGAGDGSCGTPLLLARREEGDDVAGDCARDFLRACFRRNQDVTRIVRRQITQDGALAFQFLHGQLRFPLMNGRWRGVKNE